MDRIRAAPIRKRPLANLPMYVTSDTPNGRPQTLTSSPNTTGPRIRPHGRRLLLIAGILFVSICAVGGLMAVGRSSSSVPISAVEVVKIFPHDPKAFCQGLVYADGRLFEGTGQYGKSSLREVDLETGRVLRHVNLQDKIFGEGITLWDGTIVQLTWKQRRAYAFDLETFTYEKTFRYQGEGWGLTHDGTHLIMSDGSANLRFLDPTTFELVRRVTVHDGRRRVGKLNELEFVNGEIYANVWYSDMIARISPTDGRLLGWLDLRSLWPARTRPTKEHVLNGIAYDESTGRLFVTGKNWPQLYEIRVVEP